jgi:predicted nucleic acid-binding protein
VRRERISAGQGRRALQLFLAWQIPTVTSDALAETAFDLALQFDCAFYDGLYLVLASETATPLAHVDERLRNALAGRFKQGMWIEDLDIPSAS